MKEISLGDRVVGAGRPCLIVAEVGINHNGDMALARRMIGEAKRAGADAVKFQNYRTEDFLTDRALTYSYRSQGRDVTESQFDMFKRCELSDADLVSLKHGCDQAGVLFMSTPTSAHGVDVLVRAGAACLKNGSDFLGHLPLIRHMARSGKPTVLSTGMATAEEVADAVQAFRDAGGVQLVLLACTSSYPAPPEAVHLRRVPELAARFDCLAGFSDHTEGSDAAVASVCLGACLIEKHFTIDPQLPGPDHWFSSDPAGFAELVARVRRVERMLGRPDLQPAESDARAREEFRLSCVAARDLPAGHVLCESDVVFRRPATGLPPAQAEALLGRALVRAIAGGEMFSQWHVGG